MSDYGDSMRDWANSHPVYYRVYLDRDDVVCVVCMQDFDEYDYHQSRFFRGPDGVPVKFDQEEKAREFVNKTFKRSVIHPDDLTPNHPFFLAGGTEAGLTGWGDGDGGE